MNKTVAVAIVPCGYRYDDIVKELEYRGYLGIPSPEGTLIPEGIFRDYFEVTQEALKPNKELRFGHFVTRVRRRLYRRGFYLDGGVYRVKGLSKADRTDMLVLLPTDRLHQVISDKVDDSINGFKEAVTLGVAAIPMVRTVCTVKQQDRHGKALNRASTYLEAITRKNPIPVGQKRRTKFAKKPLPTEAPTQLALAAPVVEPEGSSPG